MAFSETCSRCGEEVRRGVRHGQEAYWHRLDVDHVPMFGRIETAEDLAEIEHQRNLPRTLEDGTTYTTNSYDMKKMSKEVREAEESYIEPELPGPEVRATMVDLDDERLRGGAITALNTARKAGWDAFVTYARGPIAHGTTGAFLRVVDSLILRASLDGTGQVAVAYWESDAKGAMKFVRAYVGHKDTEKRKFVTTPASAAELRSWLKEGTL